jgi:hypothetical protein
MRAEQENFDGLARINRELIGKAEVLDSPQCVVRAIRRGDCLKSCCGGSKRYP